MMVSESLAGAPTTTLPSPSLAAIGGHDAQTDAAAEFLALLGVFSLPAPPPAPAALRLVAGMSTDTGATVTTPDESSEDAGPAMQPPATETSVLQDADESSDPMGLQALMRARLDAARVIGTRFMPSDPNHGGHLARLATPIGSTFMPTKAPVRVTNAPAPSAKAAAGGDDAADLSESAADQFPEPQAAGALIALAAQLQRSGAFETRTAAPSPDASAPSAAPAPELKAMPLVDLTRGRPGTESMVRAVMVLVDALSPANTTKAFGLDAPSDLAGANSNAPGAAKDPLAVTLPDAHQPLLRDVVVRELSVGAHERPVLAVAGRAANEHSAQHRDRDQAQDDRTGAALPAVDFDQAATAGAGTTFFDSMRTARSEMADQPGSASGSRAATTPTKPEPLASQVTLDLDPATGAGRVRVAVRGDTVRATIISADRDLGSLNDQVHDLRRALEARGFAEAHVEVRSSASDRVTSTVAPTLAISPELRASAGNDTASDGQAEHRPSRDHYRDANDHQSPRRRPRREQETA